MVSGEWMNSESKRERERAGVGERGKGETERNGSL